MFSADSLSLHYREYQPSDFVRLCELDRLCFPPQVAYSSEEIAAALADPGVFALVAESQEQVVAFVLVGTRRRLGHIITIDVHAEFRRRGIGEHLMELAEQRLRLRGATRLILEVAVSNEAAIAFYRARGFTVQRLLPRYYRDASDAHLMEKVL
jgi:ribosomal-protein-alanine acetyltransferase